MVSYSPSKFATQNATQNNTIAFTDVAIRNLKPAKKRVTYNAKGMSGFGIRVSPNGRKVFFYYFRYKRVEHRLSLGRYPEVPLREARKKYGEASELLEQGINPAAKEKKRKSKVLSVTALIDKYEAFCLAQGKKSTSEEIRALRKDLSDIGSRSVGDIDTGDIQEVLATVIKRSHGNKKNTKKGAPQMANHLYRYMHRMFSLAVQWGYIPVNPVSAVDKPAASPPRSRVLSTAEIYQFWYGLEETSLETQTKLAFKFMLCTIQRGIDVRSMLWTDIDFHSCLWTVPMPKNKRAWRIPLNTHALTILNEVKKVSEDFGHPFSFSEKGMMAKNVLHQGIRRELKTLGIAHFTPHDLRRTAATLLAAMGCPRYWVVLMLNHTDGTVTSIYDQYSYDAEKRKAVVVLDFVLSRILETKEVGCVPTLDTLREMVNDAGLLK